MSWICIGGACPFAALGFLKYNGMTAEQFVGAFIKSEILTPKKLTFKSTNYYEQLLKDIERTRKIKNKKLKKKINKKNKAKEEKNIIEDLKEDI